MNRSNSKFISKLGLILIALPALAGSGGASRGSVDAETAGRVAINQLSRMRILEARKIKDPLDQEKRMAQVLAESPSVSEVFTESKDGTPVYHILNLKPQGWAIVSADRVAYPIIGYSATGSFAPGRKNCGFQSWMVNVRNEIHAAIVQELSPLPRALQAWGDLDRPTDVYMEEASSFRATAAAAASVSPLLTTIWGQGGVSQPYPLCAWLDSWLLDYDAYSPYEVNWAGFYRVAPTGCVATATGQVMKYWAWPPAGDGSHTSNPSAPTDCATTGNTYGTYTVDYAARTYDWSIMPNKVWGAASGLVPPSTFEVAKLLRDVGNAVDMQYAPGGSGAYTSWVPEALKSHFRYANSTTFRYKSSYPGTWIADLKTELDAGRPLVYSGAAPDGTGGHAFVLDGYDASGNFHINWGWDGWLDGYYNVDALTFFDLLSLSTHNYTAYQGGTFFLRPDYPPTAANDAYSMNEDAALTVAAAGVLANDSDPEGGSLSAVVDTWPSHGSLSLNANGPFTYTPTLHFVGTDSFTYHASDGRYNSGSATVTITVNAINHAPVLAAIGGKTVNEGQLLQFTVSASDYDGNPLTYSASNLPAGASFDPASRVFTWTPSYSQAGTYSNVLFAVADNGAPPLQDSEAITISVVNVNRAPVLSAIGGKSVNEGQLLQFTVSGTDPDGDGLTFAASNLPTGATFNPATRTFSWTPTFTQSGTYPNVGFTVTDNGVPPLQVGETIAISVGNVNRAPVFTAMGPQSGVEGRTLQFTVSATDPDGDPISYSAGPLPPGASFNPATARLTWRPNQLQSGSYTFTFTATDSGQPNLSGSLNVPVTIQDVSLPCYWVNVAIDTVGAISAPQYVKDAHLATLNEVCAFVQAGSTRSAWARSIDYVRLVKSDLEQGRISPADGEILLSIGYSMVSAVSNPWSTTGRLGG